jgi:O-antigen ligase
MMALACIVEAATHRRVRRIACFGFALLLTYSGTGILALLIGMLFPLGKKTLLRVLALGCAASVVLLLLGNVLNLSFTLGRIDEFGSERSSAYIRYIAPLRLVTETFDASAWSAWLGHGPGAISRETRGYEFHDPTWAKLLFEYGALGFIAFLGLFLVALAQRGVPAQIRAALFFAWLMMGGHLLSPEQNFLTLALVGLLGAPAPAPAERPAPRLVVVA